MASIRELLASLPNGLHDSEMRSLFIDYANKQIKIEMNIWMGEPGNEEKYRAATFLVHDFQFCVIDPPGDVTSNSPKLTIDADLGEPSTSKIHLPEVTEGYSLFWIFVNEWNSFIRISCRSVELLWVDENKT